MSKLALLAALFAVACLAAARSPARAPHPSRRAEPCLLAVRLVSAPLPEAASATASGGPPTLPTPSPPAAFAPLAEIVEATSDDADSLLAELVRLSRRLLQGDLALAQVALAESERTATSPCARNLSLLLLAFTEEPRARTVLRREALSADDDRAQLALEAVMEFRKLKADCRDDQIEVFWAGVLTSQEAALLPEGRDHPALYAKLIRRQACILLAPPAEEEGEGGATLIEEEPSYQDRDDGEVLVAVAQVGRSLAAREMGVRRLGVEWSAGDLLRALARREGTPARVKAAVYESVYLSSSDYDVIKSEVQGSTDPQYLARLCGPLMRSAGDRAAEALGVLEGIAPIADSDATLAKRMMWEFPDNDSLDNVEAIERIARAATSDALRHEAVSTLRRGLYDHEFIERCEALQRLSRAPTAGLAAEASLVLLEWERLEPARVEAKLDDAFLEQANDVAQLPAVHTLLREELSHALAERAGATR